jgi:tetratricopeptide (TPR) repeat protein
MKPQRASPGAQPRKSRAHRFLPFAIVFGIALILRLVHLALIRQAPFTTVVMGDSKSYDTWAMTIAAGDWIGTDVFYQAPLYPYVMGAIYAVAGHDLNWVRLVQAMLGSLAAVLIGLSASRLFTQREGLIAGLIAAAWAPAIFFDGLIQKTALDGFLTALLLWTVTGLVADTGMRRAWFGLGVVLGALSLTRENALVLVPVIGLWIALRHRPADAPAVRVGQAGAVLAGLVLVLAPVAARNYAVGGGFYLTTSQFGSNLYLGNNPYTDGTAGSLIAGRGSPEYERTDAVALAERAEGRTLTPAEVSSYWTGRTLAYIREQPARWGVLMARKSALLWNRTEAFDTESQESYAEWSPVVRLLQPVTHFGLLVPLACLGVLVTWRDRSRLWVLYALVAAYGASVVLFFIYARYRYPLVPFLIVLAAAGLVRGRAWLSGLVGTHRAAAAVALIVVIVFTNWPLLATTDNRAVSEHNLAAALQADGRMDEALEHYRKAVSINPSYAPAYSNMGTVLLAQGNDAAAVDAYRQALAIQPDFPDAHFNLGNALLTLGRPADAADEFRAALASSPGAVDVLTNLGIALLDAGRLEDGMASLRRAVAAAPRAAEPRYALGRALLEQGRAGEAIEHLQVAADQAPSAEVLNDLGIALDTAGRTADAVASFERALQLDASFTEARRNLEVVRSR